MRLMHGLDRTAVLRNEALSEAEEARARERTLSRELAEYQEVHLATIDSMKAECNRVKAEAEEHRAAAESARAEAKAAREELETFKASEAERHEAFLRSKEFKEILGPKAFKFLTIGLQSCKEQLMEAGLVSSDAAAGLPDVNKSIASVPDDILEDELEEETQKGQEGE